MRGEEDFGRQRTPFRKRVQNTGLVQESNQVRLEATRYPIVMLPRA
jgi:hypothetical protein